MAEWQDQIEVVLRRIRPRLALHGGDVEFIRYDEESKTVFVRMTGACKGCPLSKMTLKMGIEAMICEAIPEIQQVESIE